MFVYDFSLGNPEDFDDTIVEDLKTLLDSTNSYMQTWRMTRDKIRHADSVDI